MIWPYHRNETEFAQVADEWEHGRPVLITGAAGRGKTTLAREFAKSVGCEPFWIIGTPAMRDTPLGAISAAVPISPADGPDALVAALRESLSAHRIVIVEAAECLDSASSAIVAKLFETIAGAGIITASGPLDTAIDVVLADAGSQAVEVAPLDLAATTTLVEARIDGQLAVSAAVRIHRLAEGNPLRLVQLVDGALRTNCLRPTGESWDFDEGAPVSDDLQQVVATRLACASLQERRLIDLLSLCAPLPRSVVDHLGLASGVSSHEGGLVLPMNDVVVAGHAIFPEARRSELGPLERRRLVVDLVDALGAVEGGAIERLHRARLCLEYRLPVDGQLLAESAEVALLLGDLELAERLADLAVADGGGLGARLQASRAKSMTGRVADATAILGDVDLDLLTEGELAGFAITMAINHTLGGDYPAAIAVLDKFEPRVDSPVLRSAFAAAWSLAYVHSGAQYAALESARSAVRPAAEMSLWRSMGGYVEAEAIRRLGEVRRPVQYTRRLVESTDPTSALVASGARRTLVQALLSDGDVDGARHEAEILLDSILLQHIPRAVACSSIALVDSARGRFGDARRHCEAALDALPKDDRTGLARGTAMLLAAVCSVSGDLEAARTAQDRSVRATVHPNGWTGINPRIADALIRAAEGEITAPGAILREVAVDCVAEDQWTDALIVLYWAVRIGDVEAAREFQAIARVCEGRQVAAQAAHAAALEAGDAAALCAASAQFESLDFLPAATDALAQAITLYRADSEGRQAAALLQRLAVLRERCEGMTTPAVRRALLGVPMTTREVEGYTMWITGLAIPEIADRLNVRPATVRTLLAKARRRRPVWPTTLS